MSDQKIKPWRVLSKHTEYTCPIWKVIRKEAISSKGDIKGSFFALQTNPWVNILALDGNGNVILVEQYRHGIEEVTLEIPAGVVDPTDDSSLIAAQRELNEETGYLSDKWTHLGCVSANPAIMDNWCDIYLAEECRRVNHQELDAKEEVNVKILPVPDFLNYIMQNQIHHALAVAAVGKWLIHRHK